MSEFEESMRKDFTAWLCVQPANCSYELMRQTNMTLEEAKVIAKRVEDREYVSGPSNAAEPEYVVDGRFTADELEALAICLRAGVQL